VGGSTDTHAGFATVAVVRTLHDQHRISFASDNIAGAHPDVLAALSMAAGGHVGAYGEDPYTAEFSAVATRLFGAGTHAFPVLSGTGANVLALASATPRWGAVVVPVDAHTMTDEAGAPEHAAGLKLIPIDTADGKLHPADIAAAAADLGNQHHAQPTTVSIADVTERGTLYTADELAALADAAHAHGMLLHLDGSRLANAAAALDVSLSALTSEAGVDVLSLGATKNGALFAEAVVVLPGAPDWLARAVLMSRKGHLQLASKLRFVSAQLLAMYEGELWRDNAAHSNAMAARLHAGLAGIPGVDFAYPVEANAVFAVLPGEVEALRERFDFHGEGTRESPARLMCAFDTPAEAVDELIAAVRAGHTR
jgi:threonine aldolase